jgi:hypothetical protein
MLITAIICIISFYTLCISETRKLAFGKKKKICIYSIEVNFEAKQYTKKIYEDDLKYNLVIEIIGD